jgi:hypothetical protein
MIRKLLLAKSIPKTHISDFFFYELKKAIQGFHPRKFDVR